MPRIAKSITIKSLINDRHEFLKKQVELRRQFTNIQAEIQSINDMLLILNADKQHKHDEDDD